MTKKYTLSLMFDRDDTLRSYTLNDNVAIKSEGSEDVGVLPQYVYERMALLKLADDLTTVADVGRRIGVGYYTVYLDVNEYNEVNKTIKQRKSANEKTNSIRKNP